MIDVEDLYQEYPEVYDLIEKSLEQKKHVPAPWLTRHFTDTKVVLTNKTNDELYLEVAKLLNQLSEPFIKFVNKILRSPESFDIKDGIFIDRDNLFELQIDSGLKVVDENLKFTTLEVKLLNVAIFNFYYEHFMANVITKVKKDKRTEERKVF